MLLAQVRVGLAPLRRLTRAVAAERQPHGPRHPQTPRIQDVPAGSDLAPLQRELGALLAHNERVVSRARAHAADLNHALKNPWPCWRPAPAAKARWTRPKPCSTSPP